ncbi:MAG: hypothetical protein IAE82_00620, partial [Opitutaceae bacterium]|nr:hypothetical protein [Opitutaceae bacterium]
LLRIRNQRDNARYFRELPGCLGTAVGYKYNEQEQRFEERDGQRIPAILVFVREKIPYASLDPKWIVPERFVGPDGLECASDVMVGDAPDEPIDTGNFSLANERIWRDLHEKDLGVIGGLPIEAGGTKGTAGCVVRIEDGGVDAPSQGPRPRRRLGVLTNYHVAGFAGTRVYNNGGRASVLGSTLRSIAFAPPTESDGDLEGYLGGARHRVDLGLIELSPASAKTVRAGVYGVRRLGRPYELDLDTMGPIGMSVVGVGQTLARQEGHIMAYGYLWRNDLDTQDWSATDYLVLGSGDQPFAAPGDSGKLIVTNDEDRRPIALLWGGERHDFWNVPAQASCAYATDIGLTLKLLNATIL